MGIQRGDEVITQGFNFIATIEAILDIGAKPIICNIDKTLNMCPKEMKKLIVTMKRSLTPKWKKV